MKPIAPNTLIQNRYLIVHLIGKGGMGEVYLAVDQRLGSAIALKRTFFSDDATLGSAFEREARTLARLRHPVLPKVSDHFTEEGTQYLVMDHIAGEDISKRLESMQKPFPVSWVLFWADQLLDALTYLHTHEPPIIHRDIKPQNLKITDENHIVLLDFGLSKNTTGDTRVSTTGSVVGYTPHYAPMEQIRGTGTDARSDLYSLSATLFQILTGSVPPDALTRADSLINGLPDPITPINETNSEVSKAVSDVIIKGMSISQDKRYKTAREMQKVLREAYAQMQNDLAAQPVVSPPPIQTQNQAVQQFGGVSQARLNSRTSPPPTAQTAPSPNSLAGQNIQPADSSQPQTNGQKAADFEQTLRYDPPTEDDQEQKQSSIKTEVFLVGSTPAITSAREGNFSREEDFGSDDKFSSDGGANKNETFNRADGFEADDLEPRENFSPGETAPLISFDNQAGNAQTSKVSDFNSYAGREADNASAGATFVETENFSRGEKIDAAAQPPPPQKSSSKGLAIGGLAALFVLAISTAVVGWYVFSGSGRSVRQEITSTPTPAASFTVEPTAAPTLEVVTDTNISTGGNNISTPDANTSETNTSNPVTPPESLANTTRPSQPVQPTPFRPAATPKPPPVIVAKTPSPPVKTPVPKKSQDVIIVQ